MALSEYQKKWLQASGQGENIDFLETRPDISDILVPKSPEEQGRKHAIGGATHALDVIGLLEKNDLSGAASYVEQLREQCRKSSRGVAKDALPMLQRFGIIEDLFEGPVKSLIDSNDLLRARTEVTRIRDEAFETKI